MRKILSFALCFLAFSSTVFAAVPAPDRCPAADDIRSVPLMLAIDLGIGWGAFSFGDFGTENNWGFAIIGMEANSEEEAMGMASDALTTLGGNPQPMPADEDWGCVYSVANPNYLAVAVYPIYTLSANKFSAFKKFR